MTTVFSNPDELLDVVGRHMGHSDWLTVDQERINLFAEATGDHQWIHVNTERAAAGPFGATIAHGYLTLSLLSVLVPQIMRVKGISMGINYGTNRVRFPHPVTAGSRVRASSVLTSAEKLPGNAGVQIVLTTTIEIEGVAKPACVVESVSRFVR